MEIKFCGAAQTVTGSSYLLKSQGKKILIDCGMYQEPELEYLNNEFIFDPAEIDMIFLTHAHIDHSGLIPKLYREGYKGKVFMSRPTREIVELLLLDSAKIQMFNEIKGLGPIFLDSNDVFETIKNIEILELDSINNFDGLKIKFIRAGHILGAVSILIESENKKIIFSGDIGREDQSLINSYKMINEELDYVVMESLYGGIDHDSRVNSISNLVTEINRTINSSGNVIIPVFSVHRSQEMLYLINKSLIERKIDNKCTIFLDGPMSLKITKIYTNFLLSGDENFGANDEILKSGGSMFTHPNIKFVYNYKDSLRIFRKANKIILSSSGMANGGRIMNHLLKGLRKDKTSIIFVGYQAEGTIGRELVDGVKSIKINNINLKVKSNIEYFQGFSGHAGNKDLIRWLNDKKSVRLKKVFLTHADMDRSMAFKKQLKNESFETIIPARGSIYKL